MELSGKLQRRLSNGSWVDCNDRTEEFLNKCVKNDYHNYTMDEVVEILESGKKVRNDVSDWYSECRIAPDDKPSPPVLNEWEPDSEPWGY